MPRLFAVRNSPPCGGAARLTAEPVTSSLLTLTERRRAAFPSEFSLTLRRTAPFVRIPLISPVCAFAFPFAVPSSLRSSLRVQLFPPKKPRFMPRLFAVCNSPLCGGAAARLTAEPVTSSLLTRSPSCVNSARRSDDGFPLFRRTLCSLQVQLFPPKKPRFVTSAFCCPQQSSVRRCRRTPYGGTGDGHC